MLDEFSFSLQLSETLFQEIQNETKPRLHFMGQKKINFLTEEPRSSSRKGRLEKGEKNSADHRREENSVVHFRYGSKKLSTHF